MLDRLVAVVRPAALLAVVMLAPSSAPGAPNKVEAKKPPTACAKGRLGCLERARFVSPSGSDSNPGTLARPWKTIGKAMATLAPGRTAYVRAGVYHEALRTSCGPAHNALNWNRSGRPSQPITISGYPGEEKKVIVTTKLNLRGDHLRLMNLVVDRNTSHSSFDGVCNGSVNIAVYGDHVQLSGVEVRNSMMSGIYVRDGDHLRAVRNWVHDNGTHADKDHGIYLSSSKHLLLANNLVDHNLAFGIHVYPDANEDARIIHNTVVAHRRSGLVLAGGSSRNTIANNIFAFNAEYGIRESDLRGGDNVAIRNLFHQNGRGDSWLPDGRMTVSESIVGSPSFVDLGRRDFRLRPRSPAIGRAAPEYTMPRDFDGRARPQGSGPDVGAFER